ncbi:hypothetical protein [Pseudosulfitobacter sp. SM2401]|uniref:hypothetical protein n=1 Tax=Pseudosulfitobacter sp. SM2401 TaxID=3350098 RepID=UPI0036F42CC4
MKNRLVTQLQIGFLVCVSITMLAMPMMVQGATAPRLGVPIIVLASPWRDPTDTIIAAGGDPIGPTRALFGVFATSHNPEFRETLWAAGHVSFGSHALATFFCGDW